MKTHSERSGNFSSDTLSPMNLPVDAARGCEGCAIGRKGHGIVQTRNG